MPCWNTNKPFGFLQTIGRQAIEFALEKQSSIDSQINSLEETRLGYRLLKSPDLHSRIPIETLQNLVFLGNDELARGLALMAAAVGYEVEATRQVVRHKYAEVLAIQFCVSDQETTDRLTTNWLDELVSMSRAITDQENIEIHENDGEPNDTASVSDLDSDDPKAVRAAIRRLVENGVPPAGFVSKCKRLVRENPDSQLRMLVIRQLVRFAQDGDRDEVNELFARIVFDETCEMNLRDVAHQALFEFNDAPVQTWPEVRRSSGTFVFPNDIDWEFVKRYRRSN